MDLLSEINHFYYQLSLRELQFMSGRDYYRGLSYNSLLYLDVISHKQNCTVSYLADLLNLTKSAVTIKVNEMVNQGFLVKRQSTVDKRVFYLELSGQSADIYRTYNHVFSNIEVEMSANYTPEQMELFCAMLRTVSDYDWNRKNSQEGKDLLT